MDEYRTVIVTFDIEKVSQNRDEVFRVFLEMDDGLNMEEKFKIESSHALLERILSSEDVYLLEAESEYLIRRLPELIINIEVQS